MEKQRLFKNRDAIRKSLEIDKRQTSPVTVIGMFATDASPGAGHSTMKRHTRNDIAMDDEISPNFSAKVISQQSSQALTFEQLESKDRSIGRRNIDLIEVQESEYLAKSPIRLNKIVQNPPSTAQNLRKKNKSELDEASLESNATHHLSKTRIVNINDTNTSPTLEMSKIKILPYHQASSDLVF